MNEQAPYQRRQVRALERIADALELMMGTTPGEEEPVEEAAKRVGTPLTTPAARPQMLNEPAKKPEAKMIDVDEPGWTKVEPMTENDG